MRRPTIKDIAREAGVSIATVNRVIAGSVPVREETGRRVSEAAQRIGYHATNLIKQKLTADLPLVRFGFMLHNEDQPFYRALADRLIETVDRLDGVRGTAVVKFAKSQAPADFGEALLEAGEDADVVAATALNHYRVNDAVRQLAGRSIKTFAIMSDFAQGERESYIGLNNLKVGRGAAWLLSATARKPGRLAIFVGGHRWHGHDLREAGFRSFFREHLPRFEVLDTLVNLETPLLTYEATLDLLSRYPDVVGIYVAGGGMDGAIKALREERKPGEVALVVNQFTSASRRGLADGYVTSVVGTPTQPLCSELVQLMARTVRGEAISSQHFLEPVVHIPELGE